MYKRQDLTRPGGKRFGTLVHEVLAHARFDDERAQIQALAVSLARALDASEVEVDAAVEAVTAALAHPLLRRAAGAPVCHREMPLVHRSDDGHLIEGVPDLAFRYEADGPWTVIDFKTDLRADLVETAYRHQVALYVEAIRAATDSPAVGVLLFV